MKNIFLQAKIVISHLDFEDESSMVFSIDNVGAGPYVEITTTKDGICLDTNEIDSFCTMMQAIKGLMTEVEK